VYDTPSKVRRYVNRKIKHSAGIDVRRDIHTNSVEGLRSLTKRGIGGVYRFLRFISWVEFLIRSLDYCTCGCMLVTYVISIG
jgi:hypothetical protein